MLSRGPSWQRFHHLLLVACGEGGLSVTVERRRGLRHEAQALTCLRQEWRTPLPFLTRLRQEWRTPLPFLTRLRQEWRTPLTCTACCPERVSGSTAGKDSTCVNEQHPQCPLGIQLSLDWRTGIKLNNCDGQGRLFFFFFFPGKISNRCRSKEKRLKAACLGDCVPVFCQ